MKWSELARSVIALGLAVSGTIADDVVHRNASVRMDASATNWWFGNIERTGRVPFGSNSDYPVFRNVKDYGAKGDGSTDDTVAINAAITAGGGRCGDGCDSSTTTPALVFFPPGTYIVSKPLQQYYYTHMIGDLNDIPTIKATSDFQGFAVIDANPYAANGYNWFQNQNNFFRQIRNFKIDVRSMPLNSGTGIHWQVAQATSLQNIEFFMRVDKSENNKQAGIFIENGSGGFMTDLKFHGGGTAAFFGSQQFTARNLEFNDCRVAIYQFWNWVWNFHGVKINNCDVGFDLTSGGTNDQAVGTVIIQDATFSNTGVGVLTAYNAEQKGTNGTLVIDNTDFINTPVAVRNPGTNEDILVGNKKVASFIQGRAYTGSSGSAVQTERSGPNRPAVLLDNNGHVFTQSKPQYPDVPASKFISVKTHGAKGDGVSDDTAALQAAFNAAKSDEVVFVPHGAYLIHDTINIPANIRIVGEIWPLLMAAGNSNFKDQNNPKPMLRIGNPGDVGNVEISDFMIETKGPQPGAILMEWNIEAASQGSAGLWDVHFRVGGTAGTELQSDKCAKTPSQTTPAKPECIGAFMLMHVTKTASIYMENTWLWVSDHELDRKDYNQINIYNGRGILFESQKATWLWGTASEHSVLYNYQFQNAANVYMTVIQTETAYYQANPDAKTPFTSQAKWFDPDWNALCANRARCAKTYGLRVQNSKDILVYGGGMYSFFDNYDQKCLDTEDCQENMVEINDSDIVMYGVNTKASVNVITLNGQGVVKTLPDNESTFCAAIAYFVPKSGGKC
ncbi:beta-1,3-glucanase [Sarocladium strictum]